MHERNTHYPRRGRPTLALLSGLTLACQFGFLAPAEAGAPSGSWVRSSQVDATVSPAGAGFEYQYTVVNTSEFVPGGIDEIGGLNEPVIVDWELPYFDDFNIDLITDVTSPLGWAVAIETIGTSNAATGWDGVASWQDPGDDFYFGDGSPYTTGTQVLHWYSECFVGAPGTVCEIPTQDAIFAGDSLSGFGITAEFDQVDAPYQASWAERLVLSGDPPIPGTFGLGPGSPQARGLGVTGVPNPNILALFGIGLLGLIAVRHWHHRARRSDKD